MDKFKRLVNNDKATIVVTNELWDYGHIDDEPYQTRVNLYTDNVRPTWKYTGSFKEANEWIDGEFEKREILFRSFK